jgi:hypothetical protein
VRVAVTGVVRVEWRIVCGLSVASVGSVAVWGAVADVDARCLGPDGEEIEWEGGRAGYIHGQRSALLFSCAVETCLRFEFLPLIAVIRCPCLVLPSGTADRHQGQGTWFLGLFILGGDRAGDLVTRRDDTHKRDAGLGGCVIACEECHSLVAVHWLLDGKLVSVVDRTCLGSALPPLNARRCAGPVGE